MTSSMGVQLTPGQRCLLDLLQRKLLKTIHCYSKLSLEKQQSKSYVDDELLRLKEKIKRISAKQKRFTLEIINRNGINTIPKETFFEALGLITKEAKEKLNSKTNERRRRTTANPRFSHEAIQAKRALEPLTKRSDSRVSKDKREAAANKKTSRNQQNITKSTATPTTDNNNSNCNKINSNNNESSRQNLVTTRGSHNNNDNNNQQALTNNNSNPRSRNQTSLAFSGKRDEFIRNCERSQQKLLGRLQIHEKDFNSKVSQNKMQQESNMRWERHNEMIAIGKLEIMTAINNMIQHGGSSPSSCNNNNINNTNNNNNNKDNEVVDMNDNQSEQQSNGPITATDQLDLWIDMKCNESLDGLD